MSYTTPGQPLPARWHALIVPRPFLVCQAQRQPQRQLLARSVDQPRHTLKSKQVALRTAAGDDASRGLRDVRVVPERFAPVHVADVHLDNRELARLQRVEDGDRRVGKGGRIDDHAASPFSRFVYPVDQLEFRVALAELDLEPQLCSRGATLRLNVGQRLVAVDCRLAFS